jgi:DNA ligase 1
MCRSSTQQLEEEVRGGEDVWREEEHRIGDVCREVVCRGQDVCCCWNCPEPNGQILICSLKMPRGVKRSRDENLLQDVILDGVIYSLILENTEGEKKFYEISVEKTPQWNRVVTRYGKYGSKGISVFKEFNDDNEMKKYIQKIYHEKVRKGYEEEGKIVAKATTSSSSSSNSTGQSATPAPAVASAHDSDTDSVLSGEELKNALFDLKKAIAETKGFWICDTCTFQNEDESSSFCEICQTKRVVPPVAPPGQWSCAHCTFLNDDSESRCAQCFIPTRPRSSPHDSSDHKEIKKEETASKAGGPLDTWNCAACTFWNELHERKCEMCDTPNPNPPPLRLDPDSDSQFSGDEDEEDDDEGDANLDDDYSDEDTKPKKKRQKKSPTATRASPAARGPSTINLPHGHGNGNGNPSLIYLEYTAGNSSKFYELKLCPKSNGCNVSLRYGRIGSSGVEAIKHFPTQQEGLKFLQKTAESKRRKGYVDKAAGAAVGGGGGVSDDEDPSPSNYSPPVSTVSRSLNVSSNSNNIMTTSITTSTPAPHPAAAAPHQPSSGVGGLVQEIYLTCKEGGSNKFYELKQYSNRVKVKYGRCGTGGTILEKNFTSSTDALNYFNKIRIEKINKGYRTSVKPTDHDDDDNDNQGSGGGGNGDGTSGSGSGSGDPLTDLEAGKKVFVKGSSAMPYTLKKFNGGYSCTCPGFVIQIRIKGIQATTCKHLKEIRGNDAEMLRCNLSAGVVANPSSKQNKNTNIPSLISLAHKWAPTKDPTGWIMSEKLDGMRAYWNGEKLWTRSGLPIIAPDWFINGLPTHLHLDGELFLGRGLFDECMSITRRTDSSNEWKKIKYIIFDVPEIKLGILNRLDHVKEFISSTKTPYALLHPQEICQGLDHLLETLTRYETLGGEGVMLRHPTSLHRGGRTNDLLKVKSFHDDEAIITGYEPGKGKYQGMVGSLVCLLKNGEVFKVGSGLTDTLRSYSNIPKIGTVITFKYFELTKDGVPRFPTFLRVRPDVDPSIFPNTANSASAVQMSR